MENNRQQRPENAGAQEHKFPILFSSAMIFTGYLKDNPVKPNVYVYFVCEVEKTMGILGMQKESENTKLTASLRQALFPFRSLAAKHSIKGRILLSNSALNLITKTTAKKFLKEDLSSKAAQSVATKGVDAPLFDHLELATDIVMQEQKPLQGYTSQFGPLIKDAIDKIRTQQEQGTL